MSRRLLGLAALALIPLGIQPSSAAFTATSTNAPSTFATAADFNTVTVGLADPGTPLRGTVRLTATASSDRGVSWVRFEHAAAGGSSWTPICTDATAPYECDWATTPDGLRDVRAVAHDDGGHERTAVRASRRVDNTAPALTFAPPAGATGTATYTLGASETGGSGLATDGVVLEVRRNGTATWSLICRRSIASSTCDWNTAALVEDEYELRLTATDVAGNSAAKTVTVRVDRGAPTASLDTYPQGTTGGVVTMTVGAADVGSGVQRVVFEARQAGTTTWYEACTVTTAPYSCSGDTRALVVPGFGTVQVPDGSYEMRGVAYDAAGNKTYTAQVAFTIDNTAPTAADIQGSNGGVAGTLDANDRLVLTFSEDVLPGTVASGWDGTGTLPVTVRVANAGAADTLTIWNGANTAQLALATSVALGRDVTTGSATFPASLTRSGRVYTLVLQALSIGSVIAGTPANGTLAWTPASAVTDAAGNHAQTAARTETGALDADL
jgi:hypothetical protein